MLHCWQPKHKYNLNSCQTVKSRKKSSVSGFTALEKKRLQQPARAGCEGAGPAPDFPPRGRYWEERKRSCFQATHSTGGFLERDLGVSWGSVMLQAQRKPHLGKWMGAKMCKNLFVVAGLVIPILAGALPPPALPWASRSAIAAASAQLRQPLEHTQSPIFLAVRTGCAARCSSCLAFPMTGPWFSAVHHLFAKNIQAEIIELFPRIKGKKKASSCFAGHCK